MALGSELHQLVAFDIEAITRAQCVQAFATMSWREHRDLAASLWQLVITRAWNDDEMNGVFRAAGRRVQEERIGEERAEARKRELFEATVLGNLSIADARAHLEFLGGGRDVRFLFLLKPRDGGKPAHRCMTIDELCEQLAGLAPYFDIFVAVHAYPGASRLEPVVWLRSFFVDIDYEKGLEAAKRAGGARGARRYRRKVLRGLLRMRRRPPDLIVHSGRGIHLYFTIAEDDVLNAGARVDVFRWREFEDGLVSSFGGCTFGRDWLQIGDAGARDPARVLRLAGTGNLKVADDPRPVRIIYRAPPRERSRDVATELARDLRFRPGVEKMSVIRSENVIVDVDGDVQLARIAEKVEGFDKGGDTHVAFCPNHADRPTPNFLIFSKSDGAKVFHCRRGDCAPSEPSNVPVAARWCAKIGIPIETIQSATSIRRENGWYARIAHVDDALADAAFMRVVSTINARRTHNEVALWDAWCPFTQSDFDDEEKRGYGPLDEDDVPAVRLFFDTEKGMQLRCTCDTCRSGGIGMMRRLCEKFGISRARRLAQPRDLEDQNFSADDWIRSLREDA